MADITLVATTRTEFGKGAARRLRRARQIPAVIYGHGAEPLHISLPSHETMLALKQSNALFSIVLGDTTTTAIIKDVQRDVVTTGIEHVDLLIVRKGEKVVVDVPVVIVGEPVPGAAFLVEMQSIAVEAEATNLPRSIEVSIAGYAIGSLVHAGEIALPDGITLAIEPSLSVVVITAV